MPAFLDAITTNETYFYRDHPPLRVARRTRSSPRSRRRPRSGSGRGRCGSGRRPAAPGEEPYSIALKVAVATAPARRLEDHAARDRPERRGARRGPRRHRTTSGPSTWSAPRSGSGTSTQDPTARRWTIKAEVRAMVTWKLHNLLDAAPRRAVRLHLHQERADLLRRGVEAGRGEEPARRPGPRGIPGGRPDRGDLQRCSDPLNKLKPWLYQKPA